MLEYFDDETGNGKLYINYPMVESVFYTKQLPDKDYLSYDITREKCYNFKALVRDFSFYNSCLLYTSIERADTVSLLESKAMISGCFTDYVHWSAFAFGYFTYVVNCFFLDE